MFEPCDESKVPELGELEELLDAGAPDGAFVSILLMLFVSDDDVADPDDERSGAGKGADDEPDSVEPEPPMPLPVSLWLHPTKATTATVAANNCFFIISFSMPRSSRFENKQTSITPALLQ